MPDSPTAAARETPAPRHRVRRTLIVVASILGAVAIATAGSIFVVGSGGSAHVLATDDHEPRFTAGAVLPSTAPVPPGALFVAAGAAPGGWGSIEAPYATVDEALDR